MTRPMPPPAGALAQAHPDGPDSMGTEIAQGPDAVAATLAAVEALRPRISTLVTDAARIVLVGTGASLATIHIASPTWRRAAPRGAEILVRQSTEVALGDLDGLRIEAGDLVVAISQSGSSPETLAAARLAREAGASVLALTAHLDSPLASTATLGVELASGRESGAATKSALASVAALLAIAGALPSDAPSVGVLREHLKEIVTDWQGAIEHGQRLGGARHVWMLGFGAGEGLADAGMLLWHEKVVRPATAATPSEFRHGLIEAVGRSDAVVQFVLDVDEGLDRYLHRLRAEMRALEVPLVELRSGRTDAGSATLELLLRIQQLARAASLVAGTYREEFAILRQVVKPAEDLLA